MIQRIVLDHFRSHQHFEMVCKESKIIVLHGPNGSGKTHILEAISLLGGGSGLRKASSKNLLEFGAQYSASVFCERKDGITAAVRFEMDSEKIKKSCFVDSYKASATGLSEVFSIMWLTPEHDRLFVASPETRRQTLDRWVYVFHPEHGTSVNRYEKLLKERLALLKQSASGDWVSTIETSLAHEACIIQKRRDDVLKNMLLKQNGLHQKLPRFDVKFQTRMNEAEMIDVYRRSRTTDFEKGSTQIGPHRDDMQIIFDGLPAQLRSTGEQKMIVLSLFLSVLEARLQQNKSIISIPPPLIILLDDILSHLDHTYRSVLLEHISNIQAQTWITGTDETLFESLESAQRYRVVLKD